MKVPPGKTEAEVLETIEIVVNRLARKYVFGYHDVDDMKQEGRLHALQGLSGYDGIRPLENYLWTHVRNRLFNLKRNKFERHDKPCLTCPLYDALCRVSTNQCEGYADKMECGLYSNWYTRNQAKKNLMRPIDLGEVRDEHENNMKTSDSVIDDMCNEEVFLLLDKELPAEIRQSYIKMRYGVKLPKAERLKVEAEILKILTAHDMTEE